MYSYSLAAWFLQEPCWSPHYLKGPDIDKHFASTRKPSIYTANGLRELWTQATAVSLWGVGAIHRGLVFLTFLTKPITVLCFASGIVFFSSSVSAARSSSVTDTLSL